MSKHLRVYWYERTYAGTFSSKVKEEKLCSGIVIGGETYGSQLIVRTDEGEIKKISYYPDDNTILKSEWVEM